MGAGKGRPRFANDLALDIGYLLTGLVRFTDGSIRQPFCLQQRSGSRNYPHGLSYRAVVGTSILRDGRGSIRSGFRRKIAAGNGTNIQ